MLDNQLEQTSHRCNQWSPTTTIRWILKTTRPSSSSSSWEGHRWNSEFSRRHNHLPGGGKLKRNGRWDVLKKTLGHLLVLNIVTKNCWRCWMTANPWKWLLVRLRLRSHIWKSWTGYIYPIGNNQDIDICRCLEVQRIGRAFRFLDQFWFDF